MEQVTFNLRLSSDVNDALRKLADQNNRSKNNQIELILKEYLKKVYVMSLDEFCTLDKKVRKTITVKTDSVNRIIAYKINTKEEFDLMIEYLRQAHTSCMDFTPVNVEGEYEGADWYFDEQYTNAESRKTKYKVETLGSKKRKFSEFAAQYE